MTDKLEYAGDGQTEHYHRSLRNASGPEERRIKLYMSRSKQDGPTALALGWGDENSGKYRIHLDSPTHVDELIDELQQARTRMNRWRNEGDNWSLDGAP